MYIKARLRMGWEGIQNGDFSLHQPHRRHLPAPPKTLLLNSVHRDCGRPFRYAHLLRFPGPRTPRPQRAPSSLSRTADVPSA